MLGRAFVEGAGRFSGETNQNGLELGFKLSPTLSPTSPQLFVHVEAPARPFHVWVFT